MKQSELRPCAAATVDEPKVAVPQAVDLWTAAGSVIAWQSRVPPLRHAETHGHVPLSQAQERLWSLEQSEPGAPYYHIPLMWEIEGNLDLSVLERSFQFLTQRHEVLRTSFPSTAAGPVQQINRRIDPISFEDISYLINGEADAETSKRAALFVQQPMDIERGPLMRATLYRLGPTEHRLVAVFHQMIFDGASMRVFNRELGLCYGAFTAGRRPALDPLPVTYADFTRWQ